MATKAPEGHTFTEGTLEEIGKQMQTEPNPPANEPVNQTEPPAPAEPNPAEPPAPAEPAFDRWKVLSEAHGAEFKGEEDWNTYRSSLTELKQKAESYEALTAEYQKAQDELKNYNVLQHFANEGEYVRNQLLLKHPDLDPTVLTRVLSSGLDKVNPLEVIAYRELLKDPKHEVYDNEGQAMEMVLEKTGYDKDLTFDEQADIVKVKVRAMAREAREEFATLKASIEVPKPVDLSAAQTQKELEAKATYDKMLPLVQRDIDTIPAGLDKLKITAKGEDGKDEVLFEYDLGEYKNSKAVKDNLAKTLDTIARNAREWTPEMAKEVARVKQQELFNEYFLNHSGQILKAAKEQWYKEWNDEKFHKDNNTRPPLNPHATNPNLTEEQRKHLARNEEFRQNMGLTGKKTYAP